MSVDVEEYFQVWALSSRISRSEWRTFESRVEANTNKVLDLFEENGATATFFVLGWIAQRHRRLVRDIVARGHELASHGFAHRCVREDEPEDFHRDVLRARLLLEDVAGVPVKGYRAPNFSIDRRTWWAFDLLAEAGYLYSSSVHPVHHDHYGAPDLPPLPFRATASGLTEIPVSTTRVLRRRMSCAGGGHFRVLPYHWSRRCLERFIASERRPAAFYFHPWELDPGQPSVPGLPLRSRFRHYARLEGMEGKLRRLLGDFRWARFDEVFGVGGDRDLPLSGQWLQQRAS